MHYAIPSLLGLLVCAAVWSAPQDSVAQVDPKTGQAGESQASATKAQAAAILNLAVLLQRANNPVEAEVMFRSAVSVAEKLQSPEDLGELPRVLDWQAAFYREQKRHADAWASAMRELEVCEQRFGSNDACAVRAHVTLGNVANAAGEYAKAEPHFGFVVDLYDREPAKEREFLTGSAALGLAVALRGLYRFDEADAILRKGIEIKERAQPSDFYAIALAYEALGLSLESRKRLDDAALAYQDAVSAAEKLPAAHASGLANMLVRQAGFLSARRSFVDAKHAAERALSIRVGLLGPDHPGTLQVKAELGKIALAIGDATKADAEFAAVLESYDRKPVRDAAPIAAMAAYQFASSLRLKRRYAEAEAMIRRSLALQLSFQPPDQASLAIANQMLGVILLDQRKFADAIPALRDAIDGYRKLSASDRPELADLYTWLGDALFTAGRYRESEEPLVAALSILERLGDSVRLSVAQVRLANTYRYLSRFPEAEALIRQSLAIREQRFGPDHPAIVDSLYNLAAVLRWQGKYAEAEPIFRRVLANREVTEGPNNQHTLATVNGLALTLDSLGKSAEAEQLFRRALAGRESLLGPDHEEVADTLASLIWNLRRQRRFAEAAAIAERPLAIYRKALGPDHPYLIRGMLPLAAIHQERGEFDEAERLYRDILRIRVHAYGSDHVLAADSYANLVKLSVARRQYEEGAGYASKMLQIVEAKYGADDPKTVPAMGTYAGLLIWSDKLDDAEPLAKRILAICERTYGIDSIQAAVASTDMAYIYRLRGKFGSFESYYERPLAIYRKLLGPRHPWVAYAQDLVAQLHVALGQIDEAERLYDDSLSILTESFGDNSPALSWVMNNKALLLLQVNRKDEALALLERAVDLSRKGAGKPTATLAGQMVNLSFVYSALGRNTDAERLRAEAVEIYSNLFGPNRLPPMIPSPSLPPDARET